MKIGMKSMSFFITVVIGPTHYALTRDYRNPGMFPTTVGVKAIVTEFVVSGHRPHLNNPPLLPLCNGLYPIFVV